MPRSHRSNRKESQQFVSAIIAHLGTLHVSMTTVDLSVLIIISTAVKCQTAFHMLALVLAPHEPTAVLACGL